MKNPGFYRISIKPILKDKNVKRYTLSNSISEINGRIKIYGKDIIFADKRFNIDWPNRQIYASIANIISPKDVPLNKNLMFQVELQELQKSFFETFDSISFEIRRIPIIWE